uniref:Uncharacterized protein n=1 Tax=Vespula pensylvanica TaxID=30213 RepID=A0A834UAH7_VESPE|nr:hypothetical protein H0235_008196 [Vespula pensylvanica]
MMHGQDMRSYPHPQSRSTFVLSSSLPTSYYSRNGISCRITDLWSFIHCIERCHESSESKKEHRRIVEDKKGNRRAIVRGIRKLRLWDIFSPSSGMSQIRASIPATTATPAPTTVATDTTTIT